ncbi:MAG: endonuclease/exonuclease/phosphatase family protein [Vicinamibacterales bacterium]|nr:endonuclease/exonuclease/phosphatase family protein [Vicinamibacterales bacterium]
MRIAATVLLVALAAAPAMPAAAGQSSREDKAAASAAKPSAPAATPSVRAATPTRYVRRRQPEMLTYRELVALGTDQPVSGALGKKLQKLATRPFLSNEAHYRGARPHRPIVGPLGRSLRVVMWNIERGLELDGIKLLFANTGEFLRQAEGRKEQVDLAEMRQDIELLKSADVVVLNEVDWGLKRTGYRSVVRELGLAMNMNWAYGVEFVEVDTISLGTERLEGWEDPVERRRLLAEIQVDKKRLKALHGTAVLSRYPILEARLAPFDTIGYDWYAQEKQALALLEQGKRVGVQAAFLEKIVRQVRRGRRTSLVVTLDVPDLKERRLTVAATHLENNATPESRRKQMEELLLLVRDIPNPVVVAGDLNTTGGDSSPTSIKRQIYQRLKSASFWTSTGIKYATGFGLLYDLATQGVKRLRNEDDPTARNIPLLSANPEAELFDQLEDFRFQDGLAFDFRGNAERTVNGTSGTLANSNMRDTKGFVTTFEFERALGAMGKLKLDWILVKAYLAKPRDEEGTYRFAPHFARTLGSINYALPERLSDHDPISVDLPFGEPVLPATDTESR